MKKNPFIPLKSADLAIIPGDTDKNIINKLNEIGVKTITTIKCKDIDESISYHPDIVIHPINYNTLVIAPNVYDYYKEVLKETNLKLIRGERFLDVKYPDDIAYNVGRVYGKAFHNFKYSDEVLKFHLKKEGVELINVKQGYTKCSMTVIDEYSIITEDKPIYNKLKELEYDPLLIDSSYINLKGQKYGFIGGATGNLSKNTILVSGSLSHHPEKEKIENYIFKRNKKIIYLSDEKILDLGTIITLNGN